MKKFLLFIVYTLLPIMASAYDIAVQNGDSVTIYYNYVNDSTELEVTSGGNGSYTGNVVIPEEVTCMDRTPKVTSIDERAFYNCSGLISVTIPNNVTIIGQEAFKGCSGLVSIIIPNSVATIGYETFCGCSGLTSITIPNNVIFIGSSAFRSCSGLTSVTIGNNVTSIGSDAFENCSNLTSVTLNSNILVSKDYTYSNDNFNSIFGAQVAEYIIGDGVMSIGGSAFYDCSNLTSVTIGNSVTSINDCAFQNCTNLTSVIIPNSVTSIGVFAFRNCI